VCGVGVKRSLNDASTREPQDNNLEAGQLSDGDPTLILQPERAQTLLAGVGRRLRTNHQPRPDFQLFVRLASLSRGLGPRTCAGKRPSNSCLALTSPSRRPRVTCDHHQRPTCRTISFSPAVLG
jgi:hypothetical protein